MRLNRQRSYSSGVSLRLLLRSVCAVSDNSFGFVLSLKVLWKKILLILAGKCWWFRWKCPMLVSISISLEPKHFTTLNNKVHTAKQAERTSGTQWRHQTKLPLDRWFDCFLSYFVFFFTVSTDFTLIQGNGWCGNVRCAQKRQLLTFGCHFRRLSGSSDLSLQKNHLRKNERN